MRLSISSISVRSKDLRICAPAIISASALSHINKAAMMNMTTMNMAISGATGLLFKRSSWG
jgi:hypothetical protein